MKRRDILKALGLLGTSIAAPGLIAKNGIISQAQARSVNVSDRAIREAKAIVAGEINFTAPASLPTVINIFMYGGPSELAGNLTNIDAINVDSQNPYPNNLLVTGNQQTTNQFWANAGGNAMERMLAAGDMSVVRTINRVVDDSKAHRTSIFSAQTGGLDEFAPGIGTNLGAIFRTFMPAQFDDPGNAPIIPFASFEGDTVLFQTGDIDDLPLWLRPVSLDSNFANPYQRIEPYGLSSDSNCTVNGLSVPCHDALDDLSQRTTAADGRFTNLGNSFIKRRELDEFFSTSLGNPSLMIPNDVASPGNPIVNFQGRFGQNLQAACVLALENPDTRFMTLSTGGLGGWDDHDNSIQSYENRMTQLMENIERAMLLLATGTATADADPLNRVLKNNARNDVIINCFGEFGRNVNLNNSMGWDHGNNMNLYTFGGAGLANRTMGQIVGTTEHFGTPGQNRLFTRPTAGSLQYEPFSIAASVYRHFGVQNPQVITSHDELAPLGFGAIPGV